MKKINDITEQEIRTALDTFFSEDAVVCVYLFGSFASNTYNDKSDVDIAVVYTEEKADSLNHLESAIEIEAYLSDATGFDGVDVRIINNAPVSAVFNILKTGRILVSYDDVKRVEFETKIMRTYLDFKPYLDEYYKGMCKAIKER